MRSVSGCRWLSGMSPLVRRRQTQSSRPSWRTFGSALLGALAIAGSWAAAPAVAHELPPDDLPAPMIRAYPGPGSAPFLDPYLGPGTTTGMRWPLPGLFGQQSQAWTVPVTGYRMTAGYGTPGGWQAGYHTGIDFAVPIGTPVRSIGSGTVVTADEAGDYGKTVIVRLTDGYYALYAHLSRIDAEVGEEVQAGMTLGASGNTGRSTGPHLHFEVRTGPQYGTDIDPVAYLARYGVVLR